MRVIALCRFCDLDGCDAQATHRVIQDERITPTTTVVKTVGDYCLAHAEKVAGAP